ncbi:hypothetical protein AAG906_026900 [Vitis piasezkii]
MANRYWSVSFEELPSHLILEILSSGRLSAVDLVCLELTSRTFGASHGLYPHKFRSLVDFAAFQLCGSHPIYAALSLNAQKDLFDRCGENWKRVLRFLQSVEQSSYISETSAGNMQITTGRYHTLLIKDSSVYSCGSSLCGVLGHGPETTQCVAFSRINFPPLAHVAQVSASHNHAAFVMQSGEVYTVRPIFRPRLVEALKEFLASRWPFVAAGLSFTVFLTMKGHVYTCGTNTHGQLGHGDTVDRQTPKLLNYLKVYAMAVTDDGTVHSFGSGSNFCLGHGEQHNELRPRAIQSFRRKTIHVVHISAGDEHVVALDSSGFVYTWGKGYCGALGHGDEIDKTTPEILSSLKSHLAVQVCARKRKTFVLVDTGSVYGFGWMGFGSLGFPDRGASDKVMRPWILDSLRGHYISQISTGQIFGFGDNERAQLGHDTLRGCPVPTEIFVQEATDDAGHLGK